MEKTVSVDDKYFVVVFKHNWIAMKNQLSILESYFDKKDNYERTVDCDFNGAVIETERVTIQSQDR